MSFWVYILHCSDGSYYAGHTDDLEARIAAHETGAIPGYTSRRRPIRLVFVEDLPSRDEAFARERQIKGWTRRKKQALIERNWDRLKERARAHGSTGSP